MNLYCKGATRVFRVLQVFGVALIVRAKRGLNNNVIQTSRDVIRETFLVVDTMIYPRRGCPRGRYAIPAWANLRDLHRTATCPFHYFARNRAPAILVLAKVGDGSLPGF